MFANVLKYSLTRVNSAYWCKASCKGLKLELNKIKVWKLEYNWFMSSKLS